MEELGSHSSRKWVACICLCLSETSYDDDDDGSDVDGNVLKLIFNIYLRLGSVQACLPSFHVPERWSVLPDLIIDQGELIAFLVNCVRPPRGHGLTLLSLLLPSPSPSKLKLIPMLQGAWLTIKMDEGNNESAKILATLPVLSTISCSVSNGSGFVIDSYLAFISGKRSRR